MTHFQPDFACEVLDCGYAYHSTKPYHSIHKDGLKVYLFRIQTEGTSQTRIGKQSFTLEAGDLIVCHPDDYYELHIDSETQPLNERKILCADYYLYCKAGAWMDHWWATISPRPRRIQVPIYEEMVTLFRQMSLEERRATMESKEMNSYFMQILCRMVDRIIREQTTSKGKNILAYRMKHYIEEHATAPFKLEDVADYIGLSVSRTVSLYKAFFGQSIMQYALEVRLNMARDRILFSPMSLEQIADLSGFANYTYFHRVFKAKYGMSPRDFRNSRSI
ncbi:AraC family transcriptional regulator [Caldalkalibacillus mannanilyticus]|uniref:AraC family transcriptional regulator n=1 Tax=Caldalkalibacillus mannanilyticus TaxID=1418 RepID=UPI000469C7B0|nr:AraC family transcriptional regulator [Caldalkalibacillus mannanilyticus]